MLAAKNGTADQAWVRRKNRAIILEVFRTHKTLSRAKLAKETGLNPSTVSNIIGELIQENLIRETELAQSGTGRPGILLELNPDGGCALGIEINVDYIEVMVTDFAANVLWHRKKLSQPEIGQDVIMTDVVDLALQAAKFIQERNSRVLGVGVGVPGLVDVASGLLRLAPNLHWKDVPVRDLLAPHFDCPIYVENEANAAALGEFYFGAVRNVNDFIYLSAGVGLGSGIVMGGKTLPRHVWVCRRSRAHDIGCQWRTVRLRKTRLLGDFVGPRAVEQHIQRSLALGATSILQDKVKGGINHIVFDDVLQAAKKGDQTAMDALGKVAFYLGIGIANLVNLFDVEVIVLGGALNNASSFLTERCRARGY